MNNSFGMIPGISFMPGTILYELVSIDNNPLEFAFL